MVLVIYLFFAIPVGQPMWSGPLAERRIRDATSLEELQRDLRSAVNSLSTFRHSRNWMLLGCLGAGVGMTGFLFWSLFMIQRIKKGEVNDQPV